MFIRTAVAAEHERGIRLLSHPAKRKQTAVHCAAHSAIRILRKQHRKQQAQRLLAGELWANALIWCSPIGFGRPLNHQTVYKHLKKALQSCGMENYATFHSLRHSFATIRDQKR